jgi:hypothetical protein
MSDDPRPIKEDLSDKGLFADHPPMAMELHDPQEREKVIAAVQVALRVLRSANLNPGFGFDQDDAEKTWGAKLARYGPEAIVKAASEYVEGIGNQFPTLAEFEAVVSAVAVELRRPVIPERPPGQVCPECSSEPGNWVFLSDPKPGVPDTVRPCSLCRPEAYEMHMKGHNMPRVGNASCRCFQPGCPHQKRRARAKAKAKG